jgi:hypothetical protein
VWRITNDGTFDRLGDVLMDDHELLFRVFRTGVSVGHLFVSRPSRSAAFQNRPVKVSRQVQSDSPFRSWTRKGQKEGYDDADEPLLLLHSLTTAIINATPAPQDVAQCGGYWLLKVCDAARTPLCASQRTCVATGTFRPDTLTTLLDPIYKRRVHTLMKEVPYATKEYSRNHDAHRALSDPS